MKDIFLIARNEKPAILFFDEMDAMFSARTDKESEQSRKLKTEFLVQTQGTDVDNDGILILGATNVPWIIDSAIRRRFQKLVYIPLPDEMTRSALFKMHLREIPNLLNDNHLKTLAEQTQGFSGTDISVLVQDALMQPIRKLMAATHFCQVRGPILADRNIIVDDLLTPCSPDAPGSIRMTYKNVPEEKLLDPPITMGDMISSLSNSKPSINPEELGPINKFIDDFCGQEG